ncbi:MAG: hypothetical protein ACT4OJ_01785 [Bacteroidota bacterium]
MRHIIFILLLYFPAIAFSQKYFDKSKSEVKKELEAYMLDNKAIKPVLTETDSTLVLAVNDPAAQPASFIYGFDKTTGQCNYQRTVARCDSCYKKYLNNLLGQENYDWKKINENQYVSRFADRLLLELPVEANDYSFALFKTQWTRELYDLLLKN